MNLQAMTIIFAVIFLPIILISTYFIQMEVDTIRIQASYDTKLIDATTDAMSAFEINTANEDLSSVSDSFRSIIDASNNVFVTTLATNLGMSGATKTKILPYIPAVVYTLYDGYYIYAPTQSPEVVTDPNGVYVKVGDIGVSGGSGSTDTFYYDKKSVEDGTAQQTVFVDGRGDYGKILYYVDNPKNAGNIITCTTNPDKAYYTTNYMLKSFTPYSMTYAGNNGSDDYNITINYTLDNFITVCGTIGDKYYSKSGYLIDAIDKNIEFTGIPGLTGNENNFSDIKIAQDNIDEVIDSIIKDKNEIKVKFDGIEISSKDLTDKSLHYSGNKVEDTVSTIKYYAKAYIFTKWFKDNFENLNEKDIFIETNSSFANGTNGTINSGFKIKQRGDKLKENTQLFYEYSSNKEIFKTNGNWLIENKESNFYEHKRNVIKNSIQYNLNLSMALYNAGRGDEYYQMPLLSDVEWDKILSNVSVLSFMQGLPCGMRTYSNYAIVTSTNNELMTNDEDIYYVPIFSEEKVHYKEKKLKEDGTYEVLDDVLESDEYLDGVRSTEYSESNKNIELVDPTDIELNTAHRIRCDVLIEELENKLGKPNFDNIFFQSFSSKDIKYDKVWNADRRRFVYDHLVNNCYWCIVNPNFNNKKNITNDIKHYTVDTNGDLVSNNVDDRIKIKLLKAEYIAKAKIRNNTYKSCEFTKNYGIYINNDPDQTANRLPDCYEIEITIKNAKDHYHEKNTESGYNRYKQSNEVWLFDYSGESTKYDLTKNTEQVLYFNDYERWSEYIKNHTGSGNLKINEILKTDTGVEFDIVSVTYKYK